MRRPLRPVETLDMQVPYSLQAGGSPGVVAKALTTAGLLAMLGWFASSSVLAAIRPSPGAEAFDSKGIELTSDSKGSALFEAPSMAPGETVSSTTKISYGGDTETAVHLYGRTTGVEFAEGLALRVSRHGVPLYTGSLAGFPDDYEHAVVDPLTLGGGESARYRFSVTLRNRAPAGAATQDFVWEARSD